MIKVQGTTYSFSTLQEWIDLHQWRLNVGRCSSAENVRRARIFKALRPTTISQSTDLDGLRAVLDYLRSPIGLVRFDHGLNWRGHHAALRMAVHNRLHQLESGSAFRNRRRHGSADPTKMPDQALNRVIQTCRDMELVEKCRAEKAIRMTA